MLVSVSGLALSAYVYYPSTITFAYSGENCISKFTLLPHVQKPLDDSRFATTLEDTVSVFGYPIWTNKACISPNSEPKTGVHTIALAPFGMSLYGSRLHVDVDEPPKLYLDKIANPLPTQEPLYIELSEKDEVYAYQLHAEQKIADCSSRQSGILCDVPSLQLEQGTSYTFDIKRSFNDQSSTTLGSKKLSTLSATNIVDSSIESASVVYSKPSEVTFTADKNLQSANVEVVIIDGEKRLSVEGSTAIAEEKIRFTFSKPLKRDAEFLVTIDKLKAVDSSSLRAPYTLGFTTSGGPQVKSVSIGTYRVAPGATAIVTLDQNLEKSVSLANVASVSGIPGQVSTSGNTIRFSLSSADLCSTFTLTIKGVLTSEYGVERDVDWQYESRLRCHSISTIGYSVNGRAINAYSFGEGEPMLFIGAMHGNERSSGFLMDRFIDDLEANVTQIPKGKRVIVVPRVNPDAFNAITRRNANNVDLNRNFPTTDWKSDVTMPGGTLVEGGGGSEPLSEPESKAIANYTLALRPKLVLTYHAVANNVIANEAGISWSAAQKYAELSGYAHVSKSATGDVFQYDTNGAYEDWLYEKQGIAALLIELSSMSYSQFEKNKPAMWAMLDL